MTNTIPCPVEGDHGSSCICNGARDLVVRPKSSLCEKCGDPATSRNLGFIANHLGRVVGTACGECGTVGDVAEFERRKAAADALRPPEPEPVSSQFARAVGGGPPAPRPTTIPEAIPADHYTSDDDALIASLRGIGMATEEHANSTLTMVEIERPKALAMMVSATSVERQYLCTALDDLDRAERIAKRILNELEAS